MLDLVFQGPGFGLDRHDDHSLDLDVFETCSFQVFT